MSTTGAYDRSIHSNPDAKAWAEFFVQTCDEQGTPHPEMDVMLGWFANAMMAMYDHLKNEALKRVLELDYENDKRRREIAQLQSQMKRYEHLAELGREDIEALERVRDKIEVILTGECTREES